MTEPKAAVSLKYIMCSLEADATAKTPDKTGASALKYIMCSTSGDALTAQQTKDLIDEKQASMALKYLMCSVEA